MVSAYVAGIPEAARHRKTGWLLPSGKVAVLCEALERPLAATTERRIKAMCRSGNGAVRDWQTPATAVDCLESPLAAGR